MTSGQETERVYCYNLGGSEPAKGKPFRILLQKQMTEGAAVTTRTLRCAKLQSHHHHQHDNSRCSNRALK